jgi:hypothetical protein
MATGTAGTQARLYHTDQKHYLTKTLVFGDDASQKTVGIVPAGSIVTNVKVAVKTAFTDTGTDLVDVGTVADPDGLAADVDVSSVGVKLSTTLATSDDFYAAADTTIVAQYDGANSDMAAGECVVIVEYIMPGR